MASAVLATNSVSRALLVSGLPTENFPRPQCRPAQQSMPTRLPAAWLPVTLQAGGRLLLGISYQEPSFSLQTSMDCGPGFLNLNTIDISG